ncbi:unnamed protein product, partial [Closterium sp. NIES-65]
GRLSVLHAVLGKPLSSILSEFKPPEVSPELSELLQVGDVKYHLGTRSTLEFESNQVQVSLLPNPSHLELVDPVVVGKARAKQLFTNDSSRRSVMGLILHGDAAFSGLGLAPEVLQLSDLPEYTTGGTIHVIINNQIGFTTDPKLARSSPHPSDFAKAVGAPIFHVNADDPEAVAHICSLAVDWRQTFGKDVVVDLVCYRRHGHNEQDDPRVTQPLMYSLVDSHPPCLQLYASRLMAEEVVTAEEIASWQADVEAEFERAFENTSKQQVSPQDWLAANWQGEALGSLVSQRKVQPTGLPLKTLQRVGDVLCTVPPDFTLHPQVALLLENRRKMMATGEGIDWAMAEALAFGSLLLPFDPSLNQTADSNPTHAVRLSGQDCERGTFNHRHAVMHEQTTGQRYTPLQHVAAGQERFMVCNSSLSEAAVLGFEYGFSLENENALVCWEAQFGDFANNAQAIIDNFIVSGEDKWMTPTGLVLLLPHGFDGQGPEHSSARLERYLQLVNDDADHLPGYSPHLAAQIEAGFTIADRDNKGHVSLSDLLEFMQSQYGLGHDYVTALAHQMHIDESNQISKADWESFMVRWMRRNAQRDNNVCVVNLTTPANYFHALRRQVNRHFSKPLVVMSPKYLLHHKPCASPLSHFTSGTFFQPVIADGDIGDNMRHLHADKLLPPGEMKRLVLCSGKIYYSLAHARRARKQWEVGLMRIEQLAPMAVDHVARVINSHSAAELVWAQVGAPPLLPLLLAPSLCCPPLAPPLCSSSGLMRIEQMVPMAVDHMARVINSHSNAELVWAQSAAASKTGRYGRSPSGSRDSPLAPSRSDQPSWRSAAAAPPPPAGPGAAGAGGGGSTGWGDSADGGRSAGGAAPGGAWARGGPGKNDNAWGRGGGAGAPGGARGGPGGNPWHTGGGGVGVLTGAWQQPLQHLQQPAPPPLSQQQAQLDQAQAGKGARKGDGGGALDRAGESANGGSANGGSAGDASVGAARAGGREWMVAVSACLIGHAVEVQLVQGDSYSGIFHAANEEDYGVVLRMARLVRQGTGPQSTETPAVRDAARKPPVKTLVVPAVDLVQLIAKDVPLFGSDLLASSLAANGEIRTDSSIGSMLTNARGSWGGAGGGAGGEGRELQRWAPEGGEEGMGLDEDSYRSSSRAWDQFEANRKLFGVETSFDEAIYTTPLVRPSRELQAHAERIAREIESQPSRNMHTAEERGFHLRNAARTLASAVKAALASDDPSAAAAGGLGGNADSAWDDDDDIDEETKYSSVIRAAADLDSGMDDEVDDAPLHSYHTTPSVPPTHALMPCSADLDSGMDDEVDDANDETFGDAAPTTVHGTVRHLGVGVGRRERQAPPLLPTPGVSSESAAKSAPGESQKQTEVAAPEAAGEGEKRTKSAAQTTAGGSSDETERGEKVKQGSSGTEEKEEEGTKGAAERGKGERKEGEKDGKEGKKGKEGKEAREGKAAVGASRSSSASSTSSASGASGASGALSASDLPSIPSHPRLRMHPRRLVKAASGGLFQVHGTGSPSRRSPLMSPLLTDAPANLQALNLDQSVPHLSDDVYREFQEFKQRSRRMRDEAEGVRSCSDLLGKQFDSRSPVSSCRSSGRNTPTYLESSHSSPDLKPFLASAASALLCSSSSAAVSSAAAPATSYRSPSPSNLARSNSHSVDAPATSALAATSAARALAPKPASGEASATAATAPGEQEKSTGKAADGGVGAGGGGEGGETAADLPSGGTGGVGAAAGTAGKEFKSNAKEFKSNVKEFKFNPNAKEFKFNPNAKVFTPTFAMPAAAPPPLPPPFIPAYPSALPPQPRPDHPFPFQPLPGAPPSAPGAPIPFPAPIYLPTPLPPPSPALSSPIPPANATGAPTPPASALPLPLPSPGSVPPVGQAGAAGLIPIPVSLPGGMPPLAVAPQPMYMPPQQQQQQQQALFSQQGFTGGGSGGKEGGTQGEGGSDGGEFGGSGVGGGMQGQAAFMPMPPQGMPPQGMPGQGMPPQGMLPPGMPPGMPPPMRPYLPAPHGAGQPMPGGGMAGGMGSMPMMFSPQGFPQPMMYGQHGQLMYMPMPQVPGCSTLLKLHPCSCIFSPPFPINISTLARLNTPLARLNTPLARLNTPLARLNTPLSHLNTPLAPLNTPLALLNTPLARLNTPLARLNTPLSRLNTPLSHLNTPLSRLNTPLARLNTPLARLYAPLSRLNTPLSRLNTPLSHLNTPLSHLNTPLSHLEHYVGKNARASTRITFNTPLSHLNTPLSHLNTPLSHLNTPLSHLNTPLSHLNTPLSRLNTPLSLLLLSFLQLPFAIPSCGSIPGARICLEILTNTKKSV